MSIENIVRRFLASEVFQHAGDLWRYMFDHASQAGWKKGKALLGSTNYQAYIKRFGGFWIQLEWSESVWSQDAWLFPTTKPKSVAWDKWMELSKEYRVILSIKGLSLAEIDRHALELAKRLKELAGPRQKRDTSTFRYKDLTGDEALKAWKAKAESVLQEIIDGGAPHGQDYTTASLAGNLIDNYGVELEGMGVRRETMGRLVRAILEAMAKRGKIEKDTNFREPRWLGLNFRSAPRRLY